MGGEEEFHVSSFQEPGRAEAEIEPDVREPDDGVGVSGGRCRGLGPRTGAWSGVTGIPRNGHELIIRPLRS
ncbi:hypothetical protein GCM10009678_08720 [Actinomadura kijaniata]|uniref:Uncharacterized protein n=1 Tax=Actinomadura namibiensis TaxID=182080 RepID=A0A7W3LJR5_ACTNM|nr:hypothetical protein [Actinomadura namibiensis]